MEKSKAKKLLIVGIICLAIGGASFLVVGDINAQNLAIARNTTSAYEVASQIAKNNRTDMYIQLTRIAILAFGGMLTLLCTAALLRKK